MSVVSPRLVWACMCALSLHHVRLSAAPWTVACQAPLSMVFSRQEYWSGLPFPPPGDLPDPGTEPMSAGSPALAGGFFTTEPPRKPSLFGHLSPNCDSSSQGGVGLTQPRWGAGFTMKGFQELPRDSKPQRPDSPGWNPCAQDHSHQALKPSPGSPGGISQGCPQA